MSTVRTCQQSEYTQSSVEPDFVNFALGQPSQRLLQEVAQELRDLRGDSERASDRGKALDDPWRNALNDPLVLQYGSAPGYLSFRQSLGRFLSRQYGFSVPASELMLTNGNSHALRFLVQQLVVAKNNSNHTSATTNPATSKPDGSKPLVLMDDPTYFLGGDIIRATGVDIGLVSANRPGGLDVAALETYLESASRLPAALYCIPAHHNPTGVSLSSADVEKLIGLAEKFDFYIIADEVYPLLSFSEEKDCHSDGKKDRNSDGKNSDDRRSIYKRSIRDISLSASSDKVISMGTFSKILAPGLRLGWVHCSQSLIEGPLCSDPVIVSGGCVNPMVAHMVHPLLAESPGSESPLDRIVDKLNCVYAERANVLCNTLDELFNRSAGSDRLCPPTIDFFRPSGGYFVWIRFLDGTDTEKLREFLMEHKSLYRVSFLHGSRCKVSQVEIPVIGGSNATETGSNAMENGTEDRFANHLRLSWAFYEKEELAEGARRLYQGWKDFKES